MKVRSYSEGKAEVHRVWFGIRGKYERHISKKRTTLLANLKNICYFCTQKTKDYPSTYIFSFVRGGFLHAALRECHITSKTIY